MRGMAYARWASVSVVVIAVACGGSDDQDLFGGDGGSAGSAAGSAGSSGVGGAAGGSGGSAGADSGLGGGPSGAGGGGTGGVSSGGSAGSSGSAGAAGTAGTAGQPGYTLENVCGKLPKETCTARADCCNKAQLGYNEAECIARETEACTSWVDEVKQGARTFNPDRIDACKAALQPLLASCVFTGDLYVSYLKAINACIGIFESKNGPGSQCNASTDCAPSHEPAGYGACASSGQCFQSTFKQLNEGCSNGGLCDDGLACVFNGSSTCVAKVPAGGQCTNSSQCGFGFYCPNVIGGPEICVPAQPGGSGCNSDLHCASLDCSNFQCTEQANFVTKAECGA